MRRVSLRFGTPSSGHARYLGYDIGIDQTKQGQDNPAALVGSLEVLEGFKRPQRAHDPVTRLSRRARAAAHIRGRSSRRMYIPAQAHSPPELRNSLELPA